MILFLNIFIIFSCAVKMKLKTIGSITSEIYRSPKHFGKAKLNKGGSVRREKLIDELTIHGLPLAFKAKSWPARIFWSALFLGAFIGLVYELEKIINSLSTTPTMINIQQRKEDSLELPGGF